MKKVELKQKNIILLIALVALFTQVLFLTAAYAEEDEKGQEIVQVEAPQKESTKEEFVVEISSIDNEKGREISSETLSNTKDEIPTEDKMHLNDESRIKGDTLPKSEASDEKSEELSADSSDFDNNVNNDAVNNDEKEQETVQTETPQEESTKEDSIVDIPSVDNTNDGEISSENLSNSQDEIPTDEDLHLNDESSLEEAALPNSEALDETSKELLTDSNDLDNNENNDAVNNDVAANDTSVNDAVANDTSVNDAVNSDIAVNDTVNNDVAANDTAVNDTANNDVAALAAFNCFR